LPFARRIMREDNVSEETQPPVFRPNRHEFTLWSESMSLYIRGGCCDGVRWR